MINQYIQIENVAYYTVAVFIATVIIVPFRAMNQIAYPLTATLMHTKDRKGLKDLYKKSSLTLLSVAALIFLGILLNLDQLYMLLPENYSGGLQVVLLIGGVRLFDSFLGINTAILYNSRYYGILLVMGVILALLTIFLNSWLIPEQGLIGAALATFLAVSLYNLSKLIFVKMKFGLTPWSSGSLKIVALSVFTYFIFKWVEFPFHPMVNITVKSILIVLVYGGIALKLRISEDLNTLIGKWLKK